MALQGHLASVKVQSSAVAMTDEPTTGTGDLTYQITDSGKRILDLNTTIVVEDGGVPTSESYTVDYLNGIITFGTAVARVITVTGAYVVPTTVATATAYTYNGASDTLDNTVFNSTFRTFQAGLRTGTASLTRFHVSDDLFVDQLLNGEYKIIEFYVDGSNAIKFYGLLNSDTLDSPVEGLITEALDFQITTQVEV